MPNPSRPFTSNKFNSVKHQVDLSMKNFEFTVSIVSIVVALVAGFGATILLSMPMQWTIALILTIGFISILLISHDAERVIIFTVALITPLSVGTTLPPFLQHLGHIGLSNTLDVQVIDVLILSLIIYRIVRMATRWDEIRLFPFVTFPALAWIFASALSVLYAREVDVGVIQLGQMAKLGLLYIVVANSIKDEAYIKWLVTALILGVLFEGLLGIYQWSAGRTLGLFFLGEPTQFDPGRALGTIGHPNGFAQYLAATMPLGLALLFLDIKGIYKALVGAVLGVGFLGLLFSLSRGGWLGFVAASIAVLVFAVRRRRQNLKIAFVAGGSILLVLLLLTLSQRGLIANRLTSYEAIQSALIRGTLNEGAIAMIKDHPFFGVGLNNYALFMPEYDPIDYLGERRPVIVHNVFLLIVAETGLVGAVAFLWFMARLFIQAWRLASRAPNDIVWLAGVVAFSAFTALTVHGMVDYGLLASLPIFRLLWLFAAIVTGLSEKARVGRDAISHS